MAKKSLMVPIPVSVNTAKKVVVPKKNAPKVIISKRLVNEVKEVKGKYTVKIKEITALRRENKRLKKENAALKNQPDYAAINKIHVYNEKVKEKKRLRADYYFRIRHAIWDDSNMGRTSLMASFMVTYCKKMRYDLMNFAVFHICDRYDYFNWTDLRQHGYLKAQADKCIRQLLNKGWLTKINTYQGKNSRAVATYYVNQEGKKQFPLFMKAYKEKVIDIQDELRRETVQERYEIMCERHAAVIKILGETRAYGIIRQKQKNREWRDRQLHREAGESHNQLRGEQHLPPDHGV